MKHRPMNLSGPSNAQFISLFPVFVNKELAGQVIAKYYWKNDAHWNEEGHRLVAEARGRNPPAQKGCGRIKDPAEEMKQAGS